VDVLDGPSAAAWQGRQPATVRIGYVYDGVYEKTTRFVTTANGIPDTGQGASRDHALSRRGFQGARRPGTFRDSGIGGWSFSIPYTHTIRSADVAARHGERRTAQTINGAIATIAGPERRLFRERSGQATSAANEFSQGVAVAADGTDLRAADTGNARVRRNSPMA
jgi:hypothetical protein